MAGAEYCTVLPSWQFNKDPAVVMTYQFDSLPGLSEPPETAAHSQPCSMHGRCLELEQDTESGPMEPCMFSVACKPLYNISIIGINIVSESRFFEVYDETDGYLLTARGSKLSSHSDEDGEESSPLYQSKAMFSEPLYSFNVRFPSTANMRVFHIYDIAMVLNPEEPSEGISVQPGARGFSVDRIKSHLQQETLSPNAVELMKTMEHFQQNKQSTLSGLQQMLTSDQGRKPSIMTSSPSSVKSSPQMPAMPQGLMGMMSALSCLADSQSRERNRGIPDPAGDGADLGGHREGVYSMLQGICKQVTHMRPNAEAASEGLDDPNVAITTESPRKPVTKEDTATDTSMDFSPLKNDILEAVDVRMAALELRISSHVDEKISELERKMEQRFDQLFVLLQKSQGGEKHCAVRVGRALGGNHGPREATLENNCVPRKVTLENNCVPREVTLENNHVPKEATLERDLGPRGVTLESNVLTNVPNSVNCVRGGHDLCVHNTMDSDTTDVPQARELLSTCSQDCSQVPSLGGFKFVDSNQSVTECHNQASIGYHGSSDHGDIHGHEPWAVKKEVTSGTDSASSEDPGTGMNAFQTHTATVGSNSEPSGTTTESPSMGTNTLATPSMGTNTLATPSMETNTLVTPSMGTNTLATLSMGTNTLATPSTGTNTLATPSMETTPLATTTLGMTNTETNSSTLQVTSETGES